MTFAFIKVFFSAVVLSFSSWLAGKRPDLAGFIVALPLMSLLVLPFSHLEFSQPEHSVKFAKSIFLGIPISLLFFIPFLWAEKLQWGFWGLYASGVVLVALGYFIHQKLYSMI